MSAGNHFELYLFGYCGILISFLFLTEHLSHRVRFIVFFYSLIQSGENCLQIANQNEEHDALYDPFV